MQERLVAAAREAATRAYAPYSHFSVGAALLGEDGHIYVGCNVENASYGATNCAERSALFAAVSWGVRREQIEALAIVSDGRRIGMPCGICRQVFSELLDEKTPVILSNGEQTITLTAGELLPYRFSAEDLQ